MQGQYPIIRRPVLKTFQDKSPLYRYGATLGTVILVTLLRALLEPILQGRASYLIFLIAVSFTAWAFGLRPALMALVVSASASKYFFVPPYGRFDFSSSGEILNLLIFWGIGFFIINLIERQRQYAERLEEAHQEAERKTARVQALQSITARLSAAATPQDVIEVTVQQAFAILRAHIGIVALLSADNTGIDIVAQSPVKKEILEPYQHIPFTSPTPISDATYRNTAIWISSLEEYKRLYPQIPDELHTQSLTQAMACIPLNVNETVIGSIGVNFTTPQPFTPEDRDYITAIAEQSAQALSRARLAEQAKELAVLQERQRIARELHDGATQSIFAANMLIETLPQIWQRNPQLAAKQLENIHQLTSGAGSEMRLLLYEFRPKNITKANLGDLLTHLTQALQGRKDIVITFDVRGDSNQNLPDDVHLTFYRIAQESLNNIAKHGDATKARIRLRYTETQVELAVVDNGEGFDPKIASSGFGLNSMRERANEIGADLRIQSRIGTGTKIRLRWKFPIKPS